MSNTRLLAEPLAQQTFAAYGEVINGDMSGPVQLINQGTSRKVTAPPLNLNAQGGQPGLYVYCAKAQSLPLTLTVLERHALGSQTFIPLAGVPFVVVAALSDTTGLAPDLSSLRAFWADGSQAVSLNAGTWHHSLISMTDGEFVVIERAATAPDCDTYTLPVPYQLTTRVP